jgi:predicted lipoprotein with Yx(FWY)xxD motif
MKTSTIVWIVVVIVIIVGGAWWYFGSTNSMTPASTSTTTTTGTVATPVVSLGTNATIGSVLLAANGMTLYTYNKDTAGVSNCTGQCLTEWPAYTVAAGTPLTVGPGVTGTLGTITRADNGATQLTYNGMPLYFFVQDTALGDATGQNQDGFTVVQQ